MKSNNPSLVADDGTKCPPANGEFSFPRALFIHIPKSGGTTLDSILADHYSSLPIARNIQFSSSIELFSVLDRMEIRYVSGHFPVSMADVNGFDKKITIIRNPLDVLCSVISFSEKTGIHVPRLSSALAEGVKFEIYREYFSVDFDFDRFVIDKNYGVASGYLDYTEKCGVFEAVNAIAGFDTVLDFNCLDEGIKAMIMSEGFFPYSAIARNRSYNYLPDYECGRKLLSEFDEYFYANICSRFVGVSEDIGILYDRYKESYCKQKGISLEVYQGVSIDLRGPIGVGWNNFEVSERGAPFRWSETSNPTIELPIVNAGSYVVYFYWFRGQAKDIRFRISTLIGEGTFVPTIVRDNELCICRCFVSLHSPDWIYANLDIDKYSDAERQSTNQSSFDRRSLGIILGNVYIRRVPSI